MLQEVRCRINILDWARNLWRLECGQRSMFSGSEEVGDSKWQSQEGEVRRGDSLETFQAFSYPAEEWELSLRVWGLVNVTWSYLASVKVMLINELDTDWPLRGFLSKIFVYGCSHWSGLTTLGIRWPGTRTVPVCQINGDDTYRSWLCGKWRDGQLQSGGVWGGYN